MISECTVFITDCTVYQLTVTVCSASIVFKKTTLFIFLKVLNLAGSGVGAGAKMRNKVEPEPKLNNSGFATLLTKFSCILRDYKYFFMFPCLLKMSPLDIHSKRLVRRSL